MFEWEELQEGAERFSFYDSDRFEEDSLCSWNSEPEPAPNNWRGWKRPSNPNASSNVASTAPQFHAQLSNGQVPSLVELASRQVASHIPFEVVERFTTPVPEPLQLRIAFWSFPENEDDIRLYSCLANGNADEFIRGEQLFRNKAVSQALQIGFHLSATVTIPLSNISSGVVNLPSAGNGPTAGTSTAACNTFQLPLKEAAKSDKTITPSISNTFHVAITFDRRRITSCTCTCNGSASWCNHVVAVCLHRIHHVTHVKLRAPVSESLSRLRRDQLQKFAQYLISELPQQILPTAQRLLDDLLSAQASPINTVCGAPDPTAGASVGELTSWCFNETALHENIRKTLIKFCVPSPIVFSDVNYLSCTAPPAAAEWTSLLRPLRGREPEGMWNLLAIVREMFRRHDRNAIQLLQVLTEECLACEQILVWWFNTKVALHTGSNSFNNRNGNVNGNNAHASQHATSSLCDEIVALWRLAALNPALSPSSREILLERFKSWHGEVVQRVQKSRAIGVASNSNQGGGGGHNGGHSGNGNQRTFVSKIDLEAFTGFKPAIEACSLTWEDYQIPGVTYTKGSLFDGQHVACLLPHDSSNGGTGRQSNINSSQVVLNCGMSGKFKGVASSSLPGLGSFEPSFALNNSSLLSGQHPNAKSAEKSKADRGSVSSEGFSDGNVNGASGEGSRQQDDEIESDLSTSPDNEDAMSSLAASPPENGANGEFDDETVGVAASGTATNAASTPGQKNDDHQMIPNVGHVKKLEDPLEILFARAEALHAHGYSSEASTLAVRLAQELLTHPPDLMLDFPPPPMTKHKRRRCRVNPVSHQTSCLASATLAKAAFLCSVLSEIPEYQSLAFRVGLFGLELARPPASTKALEVKMANQELELVNWLKKLPLTSTELNIIREKAAQLRDGLLRSRGDALLPLQLACYILDALVMSVSRSTNSSAISTPALCHRIAPVSPSMSALDEQLGFEAAVAALGLKANVSEAEHPLLCEGTRRQRGDLALTLLVNYKDDREKLAAIMDKLLDRQVHQLYKAQPLSSYYATNMAVGAEQPVATDGVSGAMAKLSVGDNVVTEDPHHQEPEGAFGGNSRPGPVLSGLPNNTGARPKEFLPSPRSGPSVGPGAAVGNAPGDAAMWEDSECNKLWEAKFRCANLRTCFSKKNSNPMASIDSSAPETTSSDNSPTVIRRAWKMQGPGSDSGELSNAGWFDKNSRSSPVNLKFFGASAAGDERNNSSSGKSSDSSGLSSSEGEKSKQKNRATPSGLCGPSGAAGGPAPANVVRMVSVPSQPISDPCAAGAPCGNNQTGLVGPHPVQSASSPLMSGPPPVVGYYPSLMSQPPMGKDNRQQLNGGSTVNGGSSCITATGNSPVGMGLGNGKNNRFKSKRNYPTIPNQPSEAGAHFMFELAKTVLSKAGGNSSTSLFTDTSATANHRGPHRALHMCAFQIGLYALGLHNCVSPNWLSRTYSSHVSWISGQALEIGDSAIAFLMKTWEGHLTPPEIANLADRASRSRDPGLVRVAAELALSVLPHAHALNPNEIQTAITQCKEHSHELLEKACLAVETAAKGGGVSPDVLFKVARRWQELFVRLHTKNSSFNNNSGDNNGGSRASSHNADPAGSSHDERSSGDAGNNHPNLDKDPVLSVSASLSHAHSIPPPHHPHPVVEGIQVDLSMPSTPNPPSLVNSNHAPPVHAYSFQVGLATPYQTYASFTYMPHLTSPYSPLAYPLNLAYYQQGLQTPPVTSAPPGVQGLHQHHPHHNGYHQPPHHMGLAGQAPPGASPGQSTPLLPHPGGPGGPQGPHCTIYPIRHQQPMLPLPMGNPGGMGGVGLGHGHNGGGNPMGVPVSQAQLMRQGAPSPLTMPGGPTGNGGTPPPGGTHHPYSALKGQSPGPVQTRSLLPYSQQEYSYLLAAYRVGMLAMETLATRVHDDRPQAKYAPNPPYGDDVKWLLQLSMKLGNPYLHQFCISAVHSVVSPFVLQEIALDAATFLSRQSNGANGAPGGLGLGCPTGAPTLMGPPLGLAQQGVSSPSNGSSATSPPSLHALTHHLRSPMLSPLVQRCQQMFIQCTHQRLYHITPSEYEDFVSIVRSARTAFQMTLGGPSQFQELLQSLKRSKFCKKDLWQRISGVLQQSPGQH